MNAQDTDIIRRFAAGDQTLREQAIAIHHRAIREDGVRGTPEQGFMAEVDNPVPDLALRNRCRERLLAQAGAVSRAAPRLSGVRKWISRILP